MGGAGKAGPSEAFGPQMVSSLVLDMRHGTAWVGVFHSGLLSCFASAFPCCIPIHPFGIQMFTLCHCALELCVRNSDPYFIVRALSF